jgi:hypothetical protein
MDRRPWALVAGLVVLVVVALAMSNPDKKAFAAAYADRLNNQVVSATDPIGRLLGGLTQNAIEGVLEAQTRRQNYLVASVYTVPMAGPDLRVLGILGRFVPLQTPSSN